MAIGDRLGGQRASAGVVELAGRPQIDDGGQADRSEDLDIGSGELVQGIAAKQPPPPGQSPVPGRIAAEVSEVERSGEGDEAFTCFHAPIMAERAGRPERPP